ncbi:MAG: AAA domain-containing protein [Thaumarchaeota archaeon]|nr:AAA domain-containing protein [Nitrososphaerota archaeon]
MERDGSSMPAPGGTSAEPWLPGSRDATESATVIAHKGPSAEPWRAVLEKHYTRYRERLLNQDRRNRSVFLSRITKNTSYDLHSCELIKRGTMDQIARRCAGGNAGFVHILSDKLEEYAPERARLTQLARNMQKLEEETGEQVGYVGFPFLEGQKGGSPVRGPIVLFAASLVRKKEGRGTGWFVNIVDQPPSLNLALFKTLERAGNFKFDDLDGQFERLVETLQGSASSAIDMIFDAIAAWAESVFSIDPHLRVTYPSPINAMRAGSEQSSFPLRVANRMAIGIFSQANIDMFADYNELLARTEDDGGIVGHLLEIKKTQDGEGYDPVEADYDGRSPPDPNQTRASELNLVYPSDASQNVAIRDSKRYPLVTIKGPPGTGKSQLIVNLVADALSNGQKVLVVCQKRAALDVVYRRLDKVELDECTVLMNREKDDRSSVYTKMRAAIDRSEEASSVTAPYANRMEGARSAWSAPREQNLSKVARDIDAAADALVKLGKALNAGHPSGATSHYLYCHATPGYATRGIPAVDALDVKWAELEEYARTVQSLRDGCLKYDSEDHPLFGRKSFAAAPHHTLLQLREALERLAGMAGGALGSAMQATHPSGAKALDLYDMAAPGYATRGIPAVDALDVKWAELEEYARTVQSLRDGCLKYDSEDHPLFGRKSFAAEPSRTMLIDAVGRLADLSGSVSLCGNLDDQKFVAKQLDDWGVGLKWAFRKRDAKNTTTKLLGRPINESELDNERSRLNGGIEWWEKMHAVCQYFNDHTSAIFQDMAKSPDSGKARWISMLNALDEYEHIQAHDAAKEGVPPGIVEAIADLRLTAADVEDWSALVIQEVCHRWLSETKAQNPALRGIVKSRGTGEEWKQVFDKICACFDEQTVAVLHKAARSADSGKSKWSAMLNAMNEHEQISTHDAAKESLSPELFEVVADLRRMVGANESWGTVLTQEICHRWMSEINSKYPSLQNNSSGTGAEWKSSLDVVCKFFDERASKAIRNSARSSDSGKSHWDSMLEALEDQEEIQHYDLTKAESPVSIPRVLEGLRQKARSDENWSDIILQEVYLRWISEIDARNHVLRGNPMKKYDELRNDLKTHLSRQKTLVRDLIINSTRDSIQLPRKHARNLRPVQESWREFKKHVKRKRGKPVRVIFERFKHNFLSIAPCWLMTPEAACRVFPLEKELFDLVIMDEASQLTVERALPVLYRAKRAVIAGDDKQLQPFDLFQFHDDDDEDDENSEIQTYGEKSLFDVACNLQTPDFLSWHYRSKYQELIDFSNHAYYEGRLNVSPNNIIDPSEPPIKWISCAGVWNNRSNAVEATAVLDQMQDVWKNSRAESVPSIAVITFNNEQQNLILDEIDTRKENDDEFRALYEKAHNENNAEPLIVKNIENIQGDERDVVIFSIGYAKDEAGKFVQRFGPLSIAGGENRLNVAITRARLSMIIVCSIDPSEIKLTSTNDGPKLLRRFLEYAKATSERNPALQHSVLRNVNDSMNVRDPEQSQTFESEFEKLVAKRLEGLGYQVHTQIGVSGYRIDLAIVNPNDPSKYALGIECDGATFHNTVDVRERDVLRQQFLEERGWKIARVWSINWWRNSDREVARITDVFNKIINGG